MSMISALLDQLRGSRKKSAVVAKERLQIILAHERAGRGGALDYLPALKEELLEVISRYVQIDRESLKVNLESHGDYEVLELNIMLPESPGKAVGA